MMNVIFDMETGDPDDLITLLLLLNNPEVNLKGITCYQGSPIQIGLIHHVLKKANRLDIPVGGWNTVEPASLNTYYDTTIGQWQTKEAQLTPVEVFEKVMADDVLVLTGAPLTNLKLVLENLPELVIPEMVTQGGFIGTLVPEAFQLKKFKGKTAFRTYNPELDLQAFEAVNNSPQIQHLTYVTKDLCHGFCYTAQLHEQIPFGASAISQLLKKCLGYYASLNKNKAMHDPLAMLMMLYPELGNYHNIYMSYHIDNRNLPVFSSVSAQGSRDGLVGYDIEPTWSKFAQLCE
jgi:inosine-uridine nucleoside N-ribohydrolase